MLWFIPCSIIITKVLWLRFGSFRISAKRVKLYSIDIKLFENCARHAKFKNIFFSQLQMINFLKTISSVRKHIGKTWYMYLEAWKKWVIRKVFIPKKMGEFLPHCNHQWLPQMGTREWYSQISLPESTWLTGKGNRDCRTSNLKLHVSLKVMCWCKLKYIVTTLCYCVTLYVHS